MRKRKIEPNFRELFNYQNDTLHSILTHHAAQLVLIEPDFLYFISLINILSQCTNYVLLNFMMSILKNLLKFPISKLIAMNRAAHSSKITFSYLHKISSQDLAELPLLTIVYFLQLGFLFS